MLQQAERHRNLLDHCLGEDHCEQAVHTFIRFGEILGIPGLIIGTGQWTPSRTQLAYIARQVRRQVWVPPEYYLQYAEFEGAPSDLPPHYYLYFKQRDTPQVPRHTELVGPHSVVAPQFPDIPHSVSTHQHSEIFDPNRVITVRVQATTPLPPHLLDTPTQPSRSASRVDRSPPRAGYRESRVDRDFRADRDFRVDRELRVDREYLYQRACELSREDEEEIKQQFAAKRRRLDEKEDAAWRNWHRQKALAHEICHTSQHGDHRRH